MSFHAVTKAHVEANKSVADPVVSVPWRNVCGCCFIPLAKGEEWIAEIECPTKRGRRLSVIYHRDGIAIPNADCLECKGSGRSTH